MNIISITKFRFTLYRALRFKSTVVVMADQTYYMQLMLARKTKVYFLCEEIVKEKNIVIKQLTDNCERNFRQNVNRDISYNQNPHSTEDKSQKSIKDSNGINSISVAVNTETISQEALNLSETFVSPPPSTIKAIKTNASVVNP